jgi:hypothetical protein
VCRHVGVDKELGGRGLGRSGVHAEINYEVTTVRFSAHEYEGRASVALQPRGS